MTATTKMSELEAFRAKKRAAVEKAESGLARAEARLADALEAYEREVEIHEERADGFFSGEYHKARSEAVRARKFHRARVSALNTARAEAEAPTLGESGADIDAPIPENRSQEDS